MTLILFLKPHYRNRFGWRPIKREGKKKKIYRVRYDDDQPVCDLVDESDYMESLSRECLQNEIKKRKKKGAAIFALLKNILGL